MTIDVITDADAVIRQYSLEVCQQWDVFHVGRVRGSSDRNLPDGSGQQCQS